MAFGELGAEALRKENVEKVIKGLRLQNLIIKDLFTVSDTGAWQESYYRESNLELTATAKVARLAAFPQESPQWNKLSAFMQKHGLEVDVSLEDELTDNIPVIERAQVRIARAIAKSEDTTAYNVLSADAGSTFAIANTGPNTAVWDATTRADRHPQDAIGEAIELVLAANYEPDTLLVNQNDYRLLRFNDDVIDAFSPTNNILSTGNMGTLAGLNVIVSNSVAADTAFVLESKTFGTYKEVTPLTTEVVNVPGIKKIIRSWSIGVPFVTDPMAICKITNTVA